MFVYYFKCHEMILWASRVKMVLLTKVKTQTQTNTNTKIHRNSHCSNDTTFKQHTTHTHKEIHRENTRLHQMLLNQIRISKLILYMYTSYGLLYVFFICCTERSFVWIFFSFQILFARTLCACCSYCLICFAFLAVLFIKLSVVHFYLSNVLFVSPLASFLVVCDC